MAQKIWGAKYYEKEKDQKSYQAKAILKHIVGQKHCVVTGHGKAQGIIGTKLMKKENMG